MVNLNLIHLILCSSELLKVSTRSLSEFVKLSLYLKGLKLDLAGRNLLRLLSGGLLLATRLLRSLWSRTLAKSLKLNLLLTSLHYDSGPSRSLGSVQSILARTRRDQVASDNASSVLVSKLSDTL
jgi:hypothetical protein